MTGNIFDPLFNEALDKYEEVIIQIKQLEYMQVHHANLRGARADMETLKRQKAKIREAVFTLAKSGDDAHRFVRYVFGENLHCGAIVDQQLIPPWPKPEHVRQMGIITILQQIKDHAMTGRLDDARDTLMKIWRLCDRFQKEHER